MVEKVSQDVDFATITQGILVQILIYKLMKHPCLNFKQASLQSGQARA